MNMLLLQVLDKCSSYVYHCNRLARMRMLFSNLVLKVQTNVIQPHYTN